jgi:prepilin-type N-terminal cleavage/methylation domain-containing protein
MQTIPASNQGFTLVELCAVLAVMAIHATFDAPSFIAWQTRDQVDARARALFSTLSLARAEAVARCTRHALQDRCVSSLPRIGPKLRKRCHRLVVRTGLVRRARRCFDAFAHAAGDDICFRRRDIDRAVVHAAFGGR